ncbi:MAG: sulfotransferase [Phycisphaerales bacterium]|nr:sulfotransferase [Phycisphaerales bacterium]
MARLKFRSSLVLKMRLRAFWLRTIESGRDPGIEIKPFILTGPPRSGTSLLTALLTRKGNVLVANEPVVVGDPLLARGKPARLLRGYIHSLARQAVQRGTMPTKVDRRDPSRPTTDTAHHGATRRDVAVRIDRARPLCVGVKHPISFMEYLGELVHGWSQLKVIVLARDPVLTIRSWRETTYGWQPGLDDPGKGLWRRMYAEIPADVSPLEKRAHLWNLLVERGEKYAASHPSQVRLLRYETLLADPAATMRALFAHIGADQPEEPIDVSDVRPQEHASYKGFSEDEVQMIQRLCGPTDRRTRGA